MNIAINGFGRIGRIVFKAILDKKIKVNLVAINDLSDLKTLAHLLKYDSVYGKYDKRVSHTKDSLVVDGKKFQVLSEKDPKKLPWKNMKVDLVLECTGLFRTKEELSGHLKAGAKKVVISAPAKSEEIKTVVLGVNEEEIHKDDKIISMASCTTNCLAPVSATLKDSVGIEKAIMSTVHSYTSTQNIIDGPHKDLRRARTAAVNIIPTSTGAAKATTKAIPSLVDKFDGMALRVPTPVGSLCDIVFITKKNTTSEEVNNVLEKASRKKKLKGILTTTKDPIVLSDIVGDPSSCIVDLSLTKVVDGNLLKVIAWYDNEWGYGNRLADIVQYFLKKKLIS